MTLPGCLISLVTGRMIERPCRCPSTVHGPSKNQQRKKASTWVEWPIIVTPKTYRGNVVFSITTTLTSPIWPVQNLKACVRWKGTATNLSETPVSDPVVDEVSLQDWIMRWHGVNELILFITHHKGNSESICINLEWTAIYAHGFASWWG
jgi:hypothetical protein